jgi:hypothetical protein
MRVYAAVGVLHPAQVVSRASSVPLNPARHLTTTPDTLLSYPALAAAAAAAVTLHCQVVRSMPLLEILSLAAAAPPRAHEVGSSTQQMQCFEAVAVSLFVSNVLCAWAISPEHFRIPARQLQQHAGMCLLQPCVLCVLLCCSECSVMPAQGAAEQALGACGQAQKACGQGAGTLPSGL